MTDAAGPVVIGRITGVYGIKGWVKVHSWTQPRDNLLHYGSGLLRNGQQWSPVRWDAGRMQGKTLVLHLDGVDDRDQAALLAGRDLAVAPEQLPQLENGEFYWRDLEGLPVLTPDGRLLGRVDHLLATGANDVLVVRACAGSIDRRERLIPWLPDSVIAAVQPDGIVADWDPEF